MQKKNRVRFGVIAVVVAACLIILSSSSRVEEKNPTCCKENSGQCPQKKNSPAPGMIWETFSHQFSSIGPSFY